MTCIRNAGNFQKGSVCFAFLQQSALSRDQRERSEIPQLSLRSQPTHFKETSNISKSRHSYRINTISSVTGIIAPRRFLLLLMGIMRVSLPPAKKMPLIVLMALILRVKSSPSACVMMASPRKSVSSVKSKASAFPFSSKVQSRTTQRRQAHPPPQTSFVQLGFESKLLSLGVLELLRQAKIPVYQASPKTASRPSDHRRKISHSLRSHYGQKRLSRKVLSSATRRRMRRIACFSRSW